MADYLNILSSWKDFDLIELDYNARVMADAELSGGENSPDVFYAYNTSLPKNTKNFPINWDELGGVKPDDTIDLTFPTYKYSDPEGIHFIKTPEKTLTFRKTQLPDLVHLLGAISYFYQQPITRDFGVFMLNALDEEGKDDTPLYGKIADFVDGTGLVPNYELMGDNLGDSYLDSIQYVKPKPGAYPQATYPEGWTKGQYKIIFI